MSRVVEWDQYAPTDLEALPGLLDDLAHYFGRFVAFPSLEARDVVALWTVHAHTLEAAESTPRLALLSPERGSGKTRTLEVLELVVPSPMHAVNVTAAALFRKVREQRPTLLLDESDTYLSPRHAERHAELQAFVNAGHRRGAVAYRCVGDNPKSMHVEEFPAFCPVAIAGIGDLPETVLHRSIIVRMKRRAPNEHVEPFRARQVRAHGEQLRDRAAAWAGEHLGLLAEQIPEMPAGITDRAADVWEALVAIGDLAGPEWSKRGRDACVMLAAAAKAQPSLGEQLLADCRRVFDEGDRIFSEALVEKLCDLEDAPWSNLRGRALDKRGLAYRLRRFDVTPCDVKIEGRTARGYRREDFADAWERYTSLPSSNGATSATSATQVAEVAEVAVYEEEQEGDLGAYTSDVFEDSP